MALPAGATIERGGDVVTLDAAERPRDWSALVEDLFLINKLQTGATTSPRDDATAKQHHKLRIIGFRERGDA